MSYEVLLPLRIGDFCYVTTISKLLFLLLFFALFYLSWHGSRAFFLFFIHRQIGQISSIIY